MAQKQLFGCKYHIVFTTAKQRNIHGPETIVYRDDAFVVHLFVISKVLSLRTHAQVIVDKIKDNNTVSPRHIEGQQTIVH